MPSVLFDVAGRTVVVTGGLGILGRRFVRALLEHGACVAVFDQPAGPEELREQVGDCADHPDFLFVPVDVTDKAALGAALQQVVAKWGTPQGLINSAALDSPPDAPIGENGPFETYPEASWDQVMAVNVKGVMLSCQVIGAAMARAGRGSIVNISSIYGMVSPNQGIYAYRQTGDQAFFKPIAYSASKSAILNVTRYLATYWARRGVRVNTVTFGGVYNDQDAEFVANYSAHVPMARMAKPDEYNGTIIYLLSDASSYMTGANLVIDGGWTAW